MEYPYACAKRMLMEITLELITHRTTYTDVLSM